MSLRAPKIPQPCHEPAPCRDLLPGTLCLQGGAEIRAAHLFNGNKTSHPREKGKPGIPRREGSCTSSTCGAPAAFPRTAPHCPPGFTSPNPRVPVQLSPDPGQVSFLLCPAGAALTQMMMEKKEKVIAARAASAPCAKPLVSVVLCHWFARKQKATNHRKARKPAGEHSWSLLPLPGRGLSPFLCVRAGIHPLESWVLCSCFGVY